MESKEFTISGGDLGGLSFVASLDENNECVVDVEGQLLAFRIIDDQAVYLGIKETKGTRTEIPESDLLTEQPDQNYE